MWQYLQMVSGTGNAIDEELSVGNRYRDDWGLVEPAWIVLPPSSSRRGSTFRGDGRSRFSWIFRSYTVRIGNRFTKTSEILITHLAKGNNAVEHINQLHQSILKAEQDEFLPPEV
nr:hypothetical protein [Pseudomonas caricapapayae]